MPSTLHVHETAEGWEVELTLTSTSLQVLSECGQHGGKSFVQVVDDLEILVEPNLVPGGHFGPARFRVATNG
jgi:hypothetical protein